MEELTTLILSITGSFIAILLYFKSIEFIGNRKFRQQLKEQAARHKKERDQQKEELSELQILNNKIKTNDIRKHRSSN